MLRGRTLPTGRDNYTILYRSKFQFFGVVFDARCYYVCYDGQIKTFNSKLSKPYVYWTVHHLYSCVKRKNQLDATYFII